MSSAISDIVLWQALDSRGNPTVACRVVLDQAVSAVALAPSGASAGSHEAPFIRDGSSAYEGGSVAAHLHRVSPEIRSALLGAGVDDPARLEKSLREVDGSDSWSRIGGHVGTAISVAAWLAFAREQRAEPWQVIDQWTSASASIPVPMVNIVSGGAHAAAAVDIQDVLVIPSGAGSIESAIESAWKVRRGTRSVMADEGFATALVADEGGLAASFAGNEEALRAVHAGVREAGFTPGTDAHLAVDIAANEFAVAPGSYRLDGEDISGHELVERIATWCADYSIRSVEDPLSEDDDWESVASALGQYRVVGDDRYATSTSRLREGIERAEANTVLIKPNQAGSLWSALQALDMAQGAGWHTIVSARSGDTEESWLADLAVGSGAGQIKVGSTMRSERTAKWNRLLELSAATALPYAGISL